ncbi:MAG: transcriptional repressor LexA [Kiritimatiellia bacterium]|jgi:repressor LexA|nr:transcriptional repressor LexA [Kiritimatiellia bacterium]
MPRKTNMKEKIGALRAFYTAERRVPGYNEMLRIFNYRSKNAVFGLLSRLEESGYITKNKGKIALTDKLTGAIRLLGEVNAGFPSPAEEELIDTLSLDDFLVDRPEATFMLKVTGDSMIDAGIQPGDMVLVEKGKAPRNNDIVIAEVDGEWTMKYFMKDRRGVRLEPANKAYATIRPKNSLEIGGIVRTVIRKYD